MSILDNLQNYRQNYGYRPLAMETRSFPYAPFTPKPTVQDQPSANMTGEKLAQKTSNGLKLGSAHYSGLSVARAPFHCPGLQLCRVFGPLHASPAVLTLLYCIIFARWSMGLKGVLMGGKLVAWLDSLRSEEGGLLGR